MAKFKISQEHEKCLGCGACTSCDNWVIGEDSKAAPVATEVEEIGCNQAAADACPVSCIHIEEVA